MPITLPQRSKSHIYRFDGETWSIIPIKRVVGNIGPKVYVTDDSLEKIPENLIGKVHPLSREFGIEIDESAIKSDEPSEEKEEEAKEETQADEDGKTNEVEKQESSEEEQTPSSNEESIKTDKKTKFKKRVPNMSEKERLKNLFKYQKKIKKNQKKIKLIKKASSE